MYNDTFMQKDSHSRMPDAAGNCAYGTKCRYDHVHPEWKPRSSSAVDPRFVPPCLILCQCLTVAAVEPYHFVTVTMLLLP